MTVTPEAETERRLAVRAAHEEQRQRLGVTHHRAWCRRDDARAAYETALGAHLSDPDDPDLAEAVLAASTRLAAVEHVLADVSRRLDRNRRVAVR